MSNAKPNIERLKRKRLVSELVKVLGHEDVVIGFDAAKALAELQAGTPAKWEPTQPHERVLSILTSGRPAEQIEEALIEIGSEALPTLVACIRAADDDASHRFSRIEAPLAKAAGTIISAGGSDTAVDALIQTLVHFVEIGGPRPNVVVAALGAAKEPRAIEPLVELSKILMDLSVRTIEEIVSHDPTRVPVAALELLVSFYPQAPVNTQTGFENWDEEVSYARGLGAIATSIREMAKDELAKRGGN